MLALLHTSPIHVTTFDALIKEFAPHIPVKHFVEESLLQETIDTGDMTPALAQRIKHTVHAAQTEGATVVLCTCSTIGSCAETTQLENGAVIRVDRPMAEKAVETGSRIIVAATLQSTLEPTTDLILEAAQQAGREVQIIELLCASAWAKFKQGDQQGYLTDIAHHLHQAAPQGDVIVLAQASMTGAADLCPNLSIPVLSSPRLGLEAAIRAYHQLKDT